MRLHARSARMRTARHKAPCRFVYNAATAAEMHAPYGRGPAAWGHAVAGLSSYFGIIIPKISINIRIIILNFILLPMKKYLENHDYKKFARNHRRKTI